MSRLLIHVEGPTEENFVNELLRDHLVGKGFQSVSARIIGNARLRRRRGGIRPWPSVKRDVIGHLRGDPGCVATTMVDYYALPDSGAGAWPGRKLAASKSGLLKPTTVEEAMGTEIATEMGASFVGARFVPFVVFHEFENLLFSDCEAFARGIARPALAAELQRVRDQFPTPEDINDSPVTAPSKRVESLVPNYEKPLLGTLAALEIGLDRIRSECPHFHSWLERLESLVR